MQQHLALERAASTSKMSIPSVHPFLRDVRAAL